LIPSAIFKK